MLGVFRSLSDGLAKTKKNLTDRIGSLVLGEKIEEGFLNELEEALVSADVGMETATFVLRDLAERFKRKELSTPEAVRERLKELLYAILAERAAKLDVSAVPPSYSSWA
jgi:fused signal recognition particle receptor